MREKFVNRTIKGDINIKMDDTKGIWKGDKAEIVQAIIDISQEYQKANYVLTLRQLYYQLVARDIIPNHDKVYAKISAIKDDCVYSGLVDWDVFEDRGRIPFRAYFEDNVTDSLQRTLNQYKLDRQLGQTNHIEVWTEKDAISSILRRVTDPLTIRLVVNKGYTSSTAIYGAYERFVEEIGAGKPVRILYFGDHDPSGMDMIRDIKDRLMFMLTNGEQLYNRCEEAIEHWWTSNQYDIYTIAGMGEEYEGVASILNREDEKIEKLFDSGKLKLFIEENELFEVIPVGLTMDQIKLYNPPHNPAKMTDPRAKGYIQQFGAVSWEVDALKPADMVNIVRTAIDEYTDGTAYRKVLDKEMEDKKVLKDFVDKSSN